MRLTEPIAETSEGAHEYWISESELTVEGSIVGFDNEREALIWLMGHANDYPHSVLTMHIIHPDGCACNPADRFNPLPRNFPSPSAS